MWVSFELDTDTIINDDESQYFNTCITVGLEAHTYIVGRIVVCDIFVEYFTRLTILIFLWN